MSHIENYILSRVRTTFAETGLSGLARRSGRAALALLANRIVQMERDLHYREARARVPQAERSAGAAAAQFLRNRHRGQPAFVIGTGPSIREIPLEELAPFTTFGVNTLCLHRAFECWSPTYYCLMDDHFFFADREAKEFAEICLSRVSGDTHFIVPAKHLTAVQNSDFPPRNRTSFIPMDGAMHDFEHVELEPERLVPGVPNSAPFALAMAILSGASPIYLIGCEHSWLAERPGRDPLTPHFHDRRLSITRPGNVQAPWNYLDTYLRTMKYCTSIWKTYEVLARTAAQHGIKIYNATPASFLDVFPSVSLQQALASIRSSPSQDLS